MSSALHIVNGKLYDPINNIDGEVKEICIQDGRIVDPVPEDATRIYDCVGVPGLRQGQRRLCAQARGAEGRSQKVRPDLAVGTRTVAAGGSLLPRFRKNLAGPTGLFSYIFDHRGSRRPGKTDRKMAEGRRPAPPDSGPGDHDPVCLDSMHQYRHLSDAVRHLPAESRGQLTGLSGKCL